MSEKKQKKILLVGKPNSGKSLLFSKLTGVRQKVSNFPGVTVEIKQAQYKEFDLVDYPGIYSLDSISIDEEIAVKSFNSALELEKDSVAAVVCVVDATRFDMSMSLALDIRQECLKHSVPMILALNMMDELEKNNLKVNLKGIEEALNVPVIGMSAKTKHGFSELYDEISRVGFKDMPLPSFNKSKQELLDELNEKFAPKSDVLIAKQNRFDRVFLSPWLGGVLFALVMVIVFQSIFTWAEPLMGGVESIFAYLGSMAVTWIGPGLIRDFIIEALIEGVGAFVIFVPQIFVLTFIIGILEDSGYLARSAIICHRILSFFGFSGKSFVPLLTGHACAIPAILAARTIDSPKRRWITMLTVPLTACSARLPVYSLLIVTLIPANAVVAGFLGLRGLMFFALYAFGIMMALLIGILIDKFSSNKGTDDYPFILELPPYRVPGIKPLLQKSFRAAWSFLSGAGPMIFAVTVIVWALGYFPNHGESLEQSYLASLGHIFEPVFEPLGIDWKYGVAILVSFLAREVFVGTLGTMFGIESADENLLSLSEKIQNSGFSLASGIALLVFYAVALQCVSTVAVLAKELKNKWQAWGVFVAYGALAYIMAWVVYVFLS